MAPADHHDPDPELEALLRHARPSVTPAFAHDLERRLLPYATARSPQRRGIFGLVAAAGGLAAVAVIAGLAGGGPLAPSGGSNAKARPGCTTVFVTKVESSGQVVRHADGTVTVETSKKPVPHEQQHCR